MDKNDLINSVITDQSVIPRSRLAQWSNSREPWGAKDLNLKFLFANAAYMDLMGVDLVVGLSSRDLPLSKFADSFEEHDRMVIEKLDRVTSLEIHKFGGKQTYSAYMFDKYPLFDDNGVLIGVIFHGRSAINFSVNSFITEQVPTPFEFEKPSVLLTEKEWATLFLLLTGRNRKEIANFLNVGLKTIEQRINNCLTKTLQPTTGQLVNFAIECGWHRYIPENFLSECSIII